MSGKFFRIGLEDTYTKGTKQEVNGSKHKIVSGKYGLYLTVTDWENPLIFNFIRETLIALIKPPNISVASDNRNSFFTPISLTVMLLVSILLSSTW